MSLVRLGYLASSVRPSAGGLVRRLGSSSRTDVLSSHFHLFAKTRQSPKRLGALGALRSFSVFRYDGSNEDEKNRRQRQQQQLAALLQVRDFSRLRLGGPPRRRSQEEEGDSEQQNGSSSNSQQRGAGENTDPQSAVSRALSGAGAVGTGLLLLGGKTKTILAALKVTKMSSMVSMLASTAAYSFLYGFPFAAGMVGLLFAHESGHALMMRHLGYEFSPMVFLPFMGAVVGMKGPAKTAYDDARISIAGPILGGATAAGVAAAGVALDSQFLMALGDFGLMINVFNLMPIGSLDGAHILGSLNRWFLVSGFVGGCAAIYLGIITNPLFYLLMFASGFQTYSRFFGQGEEDQHYRQKGYEMPRNKKIFVGASYLALIAALLGMMRINNLFRKTPAQLRAEQDRERRARGEVAAESSMGDAVLGWAKEFEDPEYFAATPQNKSDFDQQDPYFQRKWV